MKRTISILLILNAFVLVTTGQNNQIIPPKDANTIVIQKTGEPYDLLLEYANKLQELGYVIKNMNQELLSFHTDYKFYKYSSVAELRIKVFAVKHGQYSSLDIRGEIKLYLEYGPVPYEVCFCGEKKSNKKAAFNELLKTVDGLGFSKMKFLIK